MFTGIIEEVGSVQRVEKRGDGARIVIDCSIVTEGTREGDSIAVNGVCLTALDVTRDCFAADCSQETLFRSTFSNLQSGSPVNLERAVTPGTRLGGHIVQGHVDGRGRILSISGESESLMLSVAYPAELAPYLVIKGSVAVEGISLTIADLTEEHFDVALIPKTWSGTNLSKLPLDSEVNLEADIIAKYVERILTVRDSSEGSKGITREKLAELGFI